MTGLKYPKTLPDIGNHIGVAELPSLVSQYLRDQMDPSSSSLNMQDNSLLTLDDRKRVYVYHSASVTFYAPSDPSRVNGMRCEQIQATPSWWGGPPRYDCIFASGDLPRPGFRGLLVGRVRLFFSFTHHNLQHSCALVD